MSTPTLSVPPITLHIPRTPAEQAEWDRCEAIVVRRIDHLIATGSLPADSRDDLLAYFFGAAS